MSNVSWLATANDVGPLPAPLHDRMRVIAMPEPTSAHLDALLPPVLADIAAARGLDVRFLAPLDGVERAAVCAAWPGGSVRKLTRLVEAVIVARERAGPRH